METNLKAHLLVNLFHLRLWIKLKFDQFLSAAAEEVRIDINFFVNILKIGNFTLKVVHQIIGLSVTSLVHKYLDSNEPNLLWY